MSEKKTISLHVYGRKNQSQDGTKTWVNYRTDVYLIVKGEEEKGKQLKTVDVIITDAELKAKMDKIKGRIKLVVEPTEISVPSIYNITEKEVDGKIKRNYPKVYVKSAVDVYSNPKPVSQDSFPQDEEEIDF